MIVTGDDGKEKEIFPDTTNPEPVDKKKVPAAMQPKEKGVMAKPTKPMSPVEEAKMVA